MEEIKLLPAPDKERWVTWKKRDVFNVKLGNISFSTDNLQTLDRNLFRLIRQMEKELFGKEMTFEEDIFKNLDG